MSYDFLLVKVKDDDFMVGGLGALVRNKIVESWETILCAWIGCCRGIRGRELG